MCSLHVGISHDEVFKIGTLPCSAALYVYQAFSSSMSYVAKEAVAFRLVPPNTSNHED